jgi:RNA 2',3'-cyclic 3'-phosphodiesterase
MSPRSKVPAAGTELARLFIAISLPDDVRAELRKIQGELKEILPRHSAAWTKPGNMHFTLRFLGNVAPGRVVELSQRLAAALAGVGELHLRCERLGCFPDLRFPRVVWAWVHDEAERLLTLHRRMEEAVAGFATTPAESRFVGHITLARPKQIKRADAERLSRFVESAVTRRFGAWRAKAVELIRSELSPAGATYTEVFRANLS